MTDRRIHGPTPASGVLGATPGAASLFAGRGEMRARCRSFEWAATPLGPVETWPQSLRTTVATTLATGFPAIALWGPELVQIYNDAYIPFVGAKHPAALGLSSRECWREVWHIVEPILARALAGETVTLADRHYPLLRQRPGTPPDDVYITLSYVPLRDESGAVGGVLVMGFDTTAHVRARQVEAERERLLEETARAERRAAGVLERMADAHVTIDREFRCVSVNPAAERALRTPRAALLGRTLWEVFPAATDSPDVERQYRQVAASGAEAHFTHHYVYVDEGRDVHLEIDAYATAEGGAAVFWRDVTNRVAAQSFAREMAGHIAAYNAELSRSAEGREQTQAALESRVAERTAALARANEALVAEIAERGRAEADRTALRRQLALAEEDERRRLARELHDQLGQHLTAMTLGLETASAAVAADSPLRVRLVALRELAAILTRDARSLAVSLRPPELDDVGLASAVASYVDQWAARYGVATEFAVTGVSDRALPDAAASTIYRVLQEALTNVAKHAAASQVSVILDQPDGEVRLIVEDDGRGFDVEAAARRSAVELRLGLAGMRERAALAGGTLTVESAPGSGTTVYVRLSLERPPTEATTPAAGPERGLAP